VDGFSPKPAGRGELKNSVASADIAKQQIDAALEIHRLLAAKNFLQQTNILQQIAAATAAAATISWNVRSKLGLTGRTIASSGSFQWRPICGPG
jgi:hypothetical protein